MCDRHWALPYFQGIWDGWETGEAARSNPHSRLGAPIQIQEFGGIPALPGAGCESEREGSSSMKKTQDGGALGRAQGQIPDPTFSFGFPWHRLWNCGTRHREHDPPGFTGALLGGP